MNPQLFSNVRIFDGTGIDAFPGEVLVEGNRITAVVHGGEEIPRQSGYDVIDGAGRFLMPGMCEAHGHIMYTNIKFLKELGEIPPEEHLLLTMENARLMLKAGFTSVYSAAASKIRTEVVVRDAINQGRIPGPRFYAASPEFVSTGGLGDDRQMHMHHQGIEIIADGPDEIRRLVRLCIREGVDTIKLNISGDNFVRRGFGQQLSYCEDEVAAAAQECHNRGIWLSCHARANDAVRLALKYNFRVIYHCDFIEGDTYDLLEDNKSEIFLAPAVGIAYTTAYEAEPWGVTREMAEHMDQYAMVEGCGRVYGELKKRGLRILPGGDYGFAWNPIGTNARDLEHFVNLIGFTPAEALMAATKWGGEIMNLPDLGLVKEGFLADLLLIDGDPLTDIKVMQEHDRIVMVMKDGHYYKFPADIDADRDLAANASAVRSVWQI